MDNGSLLLLLDRFVKSQEKSAAGWGRHVALREHESRCTDLARFSFSDAEMEEWSHIFTLMALDKAIRSAEYDCKDDPTVVARLVALRAAVAARKPGP